MSTKPSLDELFAGLAARGQSEAAISEKKLAKAKAEGDVNRILLYEREIAEAKAISETASKLGHSFSNIFGGGL